MIDPDMLKTVGAIGISLGVALIILIFVVFTVWIMRKWSGVPPKAEPCFKVDPNPVSLFDVPESPNIDMADVLEYGFENAYRDPKAMARLELHNDAIQQKKNRTAVCWNCGKGRPCKCTLGDIL